MRPYVTPGQKVSSGDRDIARDEEQKLNRKHDRKTGLEAARNSGILKAGISAVIPPPLVATVF